MPPPVKIVVPPSKEKNVSRGGCQNVPPPSDKHREKSNVFYRYTCNPCVAYGLRRYFPAYLVAIMTSLTYQTRTIFAAHLLHCTDLEQFIFHQH